MTLFERRPWHPCRERLFDDLPVEQRIVAERWLGRFLARHKHRLSFDRWLYPILIGRARRLATHPEQSSRGWGKWMIAKRGGYAVQQKYRIEGRTGSHHPALRASRVSALRRKWRKQAEAEAERRRRMGLPAKRRWSRLPIG